MLKATLAQNMSEFRAVLPAKGRAVGTHVSISLAIFVVLLYLIAVRWYPSPYFFVDGGWHGVRLMFAIDVVLGPLLTFIVFTPAKRRPLIIMDLSVIAALQLAALAWGVWTVYDQRPAAVVEWDGTFESVIAGEYQMHGLELSTLAQYDDRQPPVIFQHVPGADDIEASRWTMEMVNQGWHRGALTDLYRRFRDHLPEVFEHAATFESKIVEMYPALVPQFKRMREKHGDSVGFLPFKGRHGNTVLVLNRAGDVIDSVAIPD